MIRVAHFEDYAHAEAVRQRLTQAGIAARIQTRFGLARLWYVPKKRAGVRVEVPAKDAERAGLLLQGWDSNYECLSSAVHCPECHSLRVDYPQFTGKSFLTNVAMGLMAEFRLIERDYYCEECHCMWAKPGAKLPSLPAHPAPDYFLEDMPHPSSPSGGARDECGILKKRQQRRRSRTQPRLRFAWRRVCFGAILFFVTNQGHLYAAQNAGVDASSAHTENPTYLRDVLPILMGKCARCHSEQNHLMQNWLDYRTASAERWEIKRRVWDSWSGAYFKQPMPTVNSPEHEAISDEERAIIRDWVESGASQGVRPVFSGAHSKPERIEQGKRLFATICAACHQPTGQGIPGRFPPLAGSDLLNSDKHRAIKIVVNGLQGEVTVNGQKFNNSMPKFPLSDEEIASALTYVYSAFGNSGKDVTPDEVNLVRAEKNDLNLGAKVTEEKSPYE